MIPPFLSIKIGCTRKGGIVKWKLYLMVPSFLLIKNGCTRKVGIIKWKSDTPNNTDPSMSPHKKWASQRRWNH